jgi:hypothetical protein
VNHLPDITLLRKNRVPMYVIIGSPAYRLPFNKIGSQHLANSTPFKILNRCGVVHINLTFIIGVIVMNTMNEQVKHILLMKVIALRDLLLGDLVLTPEQFHQFNELTTTITEMIRVGVA